MGRAWRRSHQFKWELYFGTHTFGTHCPSPNADTIMYALVFSVIIFLWQQRNISRTGFECKLLMPASFQDDQESMTITKKGILGALCYEVVHMLVPSNIVLWVWVSHKQTGDWSAHVGRNWAFAFHFLGRYSQGLGLYQRGYTQDVRALWRNALLGLSVRKWCLTCLHMWQCILFFQIWPRGFCASHFLLMCFKTTNWADCLSIHGYVCAHHIEEILWTHWAFILNIWWETWRAGLTPMRCWSARRTITF